MTFVLWMSAAMALFGALTGVAEGFAARRLPRYQVAWILRVGLGVMALPLVLHAYFTYRYATGFVDLELGPDPVGVYPGAVNFLVASIVILVALLALAIRVAPRWPRVASLFPALLFTAYFNLAMPLLQLEAPGGGMLIDNMPAIWLFFLTVMATAMLFVFSTIAFRKPEMAG